MSKLVLSLILISMVVVAPISAEEIKLTAIVPDQQLVRGKDGAIGSSYRSKTDADVPDGNLIVQGNVGIGTPNPNTALDLSGAFSARGMAAPAVSPAGEGRLYFDSTAGVNKFKVSENGGAYKDLAGGGVGVLGVWNDINKDGLAETVSNNVVYLAQTDGFVCAYGLNHVVRGYTDSTTSPATQRIANGWEGTSAILNSVTFVVRKNDYWKVTGASTVYWVPLG